MIQTRIEGLRYSVHAWIKALGSQPVDNNHYNDNNNNFKAKLCF